MSWPQWPAAPGGWPAAAVAATATPGIAPGLTPGTQYTADQWAAMTALQQQNWHQWVQWQQQYQQWQAQYGEQYAKSMALTNPTQPYVTAATITVQPPLPAAEVAVTAPPLPKDTRPPLPPEEPPKPTCTPMPQANSGIVFNANVPPPLLLNNQANQQHQGYTTKGSNQGYTTQGNTQNSNQGYNTQGVAPGQATRAYGPHMPPNTNQQQKNIPRFNQNNPPSLLSLNFANQRNQSFTSDKSDFNNKRPGEFRDTFEDTKKNRWETKDESSNWSSGDKFQQGSSNSSANSKPWTQHGHDNVDKNKSWSHSSTNDNNENWKGNNQNLNARNLRSNRPKVEELSEAEKNFDQQFEQWEAQFNKWKEQNVGHPDKQQYKEYEAKWESWRAQLLERREQMRKKRLGICPTSGNTSKTTSDNNLHADESVKEDIESESVPKDASTPIKATPAVENKMVESKVSESKDSINEKEKNTTENEQDDDSSCSFLFSQPPKEQRTNIRSRRSSIKQDIDPVSALPTDTSFLQSSQSNAGIPGLDLVKDDDSKEDNSDKKQLEVENKIQNLEAISQGINSILGDEKLLNMLSMVSQNKKVEPETSTPIKDNTQTQMQMNISNEFNNTQPNNYTDNTSYSENQYYDKGNDFNNQVPPNFNRPLNFDSKPPNFDITTRPPNFDITNRPPNFDIDERIQNKPPNFDTRPPNFDTRPPNFDTRPPNFDTRPPNFDNRLSNFDIRPPNFESRPPPNFANRPPPNFDRGSNFDNRPQSNFDNHSQSKFNNRPPPLLDNKPPPLIDDRTPSLLGNRLPPLLDARTPLLGNRPPPLLDDRTSLLGNRPPSLLDDRNPSLLGSRPPPLMNNRPQSNFENRPPLLDNRSQPNFENKPPSLLGNRFQSNFENRSQANFDNNRPPPNFENRSQSMFDRKPFDNKLFDNKPFDNKPFDNKPFDNKPFDNKPFDNKPFDNKPFDNKPFDNKPFDNKPFDNKPFDNKPFDSKPFDNNSFDNKPFDNKPFDNKPFDNKPFDNKPFDNTHFDNKLNFGNRQSNFDNRFQDNFDNRSRGPPIGDHNSNNFNPRSEFNAQPHQQNEFGSNNQGPPQNRLRMDNPPFNNRPDFSQMPPNRGPNNFNNRGPNDHNWGGPNGANNFRRNLDPFNDDFNSSNRGPNFGGQFNNNQNRENFSRPPRGQDMYDDPMRNDRNDCFNSNSYDESQDNRFDDDPNFEPPRNSSDFDAPGPNKEWEEDKKFGGNIDSKSEERKDYNRGADQYWDEALILKPFTVIDYEHKAKIGSTFVEPVQTFDYNHASKIADKERQIQPARDSRDLSLNKFGRPNDLNTLKNKTFPIPEKNSPQFSKNSPQFPRNNPQFSRNSPQFSRNSPQFSKNSPQPSRNNPNQNKFSPYQSDKINQDNISLSKSKFNQLDMEDYDDIEDDPFADDELPEDSFKDKVERFTNTPNYNKDKTNTVTMIEDLLSPPGRNTRPPRMAIILRGPPGSGKTFLAKLIKDKEVEQGGSAPRILSLDDYFMVEQEKEVIEAETGRKTLVKEMVYEYEECMDLAYRQSLERAFKKTITDGYFPFIILDCVNDKVKYFAEMWSFAKQKGFQVYVCQMELDVAACTKRNTHHRSEVEIQRLVAGWETTPSHYLSLDSTSLMQSGCISEVEMEEVENLNDGDQDDEDTQDHVISKWEKMEHSGDKLARLDGISKPLRPKTMEDYLQIDDEIPEERTGIKRVRWADLEERRHQEKIRAVGFVVGQTDWNRMMDPSQGSSALTQTKYIERVRRF